MDVVFSKQKRKNSNVIIFFGGFSADKNSAANSAIGHGLGLYSDLSMDITQSWGSHMCNRIQ